MERNARVVVLSTLILMLIAVGAPAGAADDTASRPQVGEVRALAVAPTNAASISTLHQQGWLEARGQLLSAREFPELYKTIGRGWTSDRVSEDRFAVPQVYDRSRTGRDSRDPFGVLFPDEPEAGGRVLKAWVRQAPLSYWIFVGRSLSGTSVDGRPSRP